MELREFFSEEAIKIFLEGPAKGKGVTAVARESEVMSALVEEEVSV